MICLFFIQVLYQILTELFQVKKIARRQNQDGGKIKKDGDGNSEKSKNKTSGEKKDEDSESDCSYIGQNDSNGKSASLTFYKLFLARF